MIIKFDDYKPYKDGKTNDAYNFNKAILDLNSSGGGTLVVSSGKYMCGTIKLLSNVTLKLQKGAEIILSDDLNDFFNIEVKREINTKKVYDNCEYNGKPSKYFIYATNCDNILISGEGVINGNEKIFYGEESKYHIAGKFYPRIPLVYFENCTNVKILDVTFKSSAFWTTHLVGCNNVLIDNLTIDNNLKMINSDGIDPDHCKNVEIRNCNIKSADDCIVLKCTEAFKCYGDCENIYVHNCNLTSTSAALKIGTETVSNFNNIRYENINIKDTNRGISIQLRDEGNISNVSFTNININTMRFNPLYYWGRAEGIAITAIPRNLGRVGNINDIIFNNINIVGENGILLYGNYNNNNISNINFLDVNLSLDKKTKWTNENIDLRPSNIQTVEGSTFAVFARNAKNICFSNFKYTTSNINLVNPVNVNKDEVKFMN